MTDTKTAKAKTTTKPAPKAETETEFTADAFAMTGYEMPEAVREWAQTSIDNAKQVYGKFRKASEAMTDLTEETLTVGRDGLTDLNLKALDSAKASADAGFALMRDLFAAKTVAEAVELQTTYARERFEALSGQTKEFHEAASKLAEDLSKPVKDAYSREFG